MATLVSALNTEFTPAAGDFIAQATAEHALHGISDGARSFNSSWPDGACTIGYHGIFIPAS